jgi:DNA-binding Lrp family transcriptional regulator
MINAYILGQISPNTEKATVDQLNNINGVQEAHIVFGKFDIIAKISADTEEILNTIILDKVRQIPELVKTQTLLVAE